MGKIRLFERFFPPKSDFFKLLAEQVDKVQTGLGAFAEFMDNPTHENRKRVENYEEEADELRRILIDELNRSFVTPIDREDIYALSRDVDDVLDYAKSTVEEMELFKISPNTHIKKMVEALHNASKDINCAIKHIREHPGVCAEHLVRAKKAENFIEHRYREALVELFEEKDIIKILKTREIYRHLSNAGDRVAEAADVIGDILVKIT